MSSESVSYRQFLLRLRSLARIALQQYGLEIVKLEFISYSGNGLYRIVIPESKASLPLPPGRYALRLHQPGYMKPEYIWSEIEWLSALVDSGIEVPRPYRNLDEKWLTTADGGYAVPQQRINRAMLAIEKGRRPSVLGIKTMCEILLEVLKEGHDAIPPRHQEGVLSQDYDFTSDTVTDGKLGVQIAETLVLLEDIKTSLDEQEMLSSYKSFQSVTELLRTDFVEEAVFLMKRGFQVFLRELLEKKGYDIRVGIKGTNVDFLIRALINEGKITEPDNRRIRRLFSQMNSVAHGFWVPSRFESLKVIHESASHIERLLSEFE